MHRKHHLLLLVVLCLSPVVCSAASPTVVSNLFVSFVYEDPNEQAGIGFAEIPEDPMASSGIELDSTFTVELDHHSDMASMVSDAFGRWVFLSVPSLERVYRVDGSTGAIVDTIEVVNPTRLAVLDAGRTLVVLQDSLQQLTTIDVKSGLPFATTPLDGSIRGFTASRTDSSVYLSVPSTRRIQELDLHGVLHNIANLTFAPGVIAADPLRDRLYVAWADSAALSTYDLQQGEITPVEWEPPSVITFVATDGVGRHLYAARAGWHRAAEFELPDCSFRREISTGHDEVFRVRRAFYEEKIYFTGVVYPSDISIFGLPDQWESRTVTVWDVEEEEIEPVLLHSVEVFLRFELVEPRTRIPGDFDFDDRVTYEDFLLFAQAFGKHRTSSEWSRLYDLNDDGRVTYADFLVFVSNFGKRFIW